MPEEPCRMRAEPATEKKQFEDEALETIWELLEKGPDVHLSQLSSELKNEQALIGMEADGLIKITGSKVEFTEQGRLRARDITRRHRLAERLFADVLALNEYEEDACRLEHVISTEVEEAICTFLGHPPTCPHGRPIPRGKCCKLYARNVTPLVVSLADAHVGDDFRVVFLRTPMIDRLASIGLVAGSTIKLFQKKPSYVIKIDETTIAIDEEVARGIFVKKHERRPEEFS
ncbi:MAG: metal-dependent transcriptional regulator [Nitrospiraceae bacterium]|nr:metal-dependent transcriptional regulator [Nitrospiraceae bacterium]